MNHPFPFELPNNSNEEVSVSQRTFKNGRIFVATTERLVEFIDMSGTKSYKLVSMGSADCGCHAALNDLYMCELCIWKVVCFNHAAVCSSCKLTVCRDCSFSVIYEEDVEKPYPPSRVLCRECLETVIRDRTPTLIRLSRKLLDWIRP